MTCTKYGHNITGGWAFSVCKCPPCQKENERKKEHWHRERKPQLEAMLKGWKAGAEAMQKKVSG